MKTWFWKSFLLVYFGVLVVHTLEIGLSWSVAPFLLIGFFLALFSHRTSHVISLLFLVAHMTIEAMEYGTQGGSFTPIVLLWVAIHVAMDGVFLWGEVKRHFYQVRYQMWSTIALGVACIYFFLPKVASISGVIEGHQSTVEFIVLGGVIGCVLSHILPHIHKHS
jgi:hypothetical protein